MFHLAVESPRVRTDVDVSNFFVDVVSLEVVLKLQAVTGLNPFDENWDYLLTKSANVT